MRTTNLFLNSPVTACLHPCFERFDDLIDVINAPAPGAAAERPQRELAGAQRGRQDILIARGGFRALAHENGVAGPEGGVRGLVDVIEQQGVLARAKVAQFHPVGKSRSAPGAKPPDAARAPPPRPAAAKI
jgi:hypothetical protein